MEINKHKTNSPIKVNIKRAECIESIHSVYAVILDSEGKIVESYGDPLYKTFPRSAIKMLQALPLLESGAAEEYKLKDYHIALACASHSAEPEHITAVEEWMKLVGFNANDFACGAHYSYHEPTAHNMIRNNITPTRVHNNCSGKHSGMITVCKYYGDDPNGYQLYNHPAQVRVRKILSETMQINHDELSYGIDGCAIPTYFTPLYNIALGMTHFLNQKNSLERDFAVKRIIKSIVENPLYISGHDEMTFEINKETKGKAIIKVGAEGVYCGILPNEGKAFVVKALDGNSRASEVVTALLLKEHKGISESDLHLLKDWCYPKITNWNKDVVGEITVEGIK